MEKHLTYALGYKSLAVSLQFYAAAMLFKRCRPRRRTPNRSGQMLIVILWL